MLQITSCTRSSRRRWSTKRKTCRKFRRNKLSVRLLLFSWGITRSPVWRDSSCVWSLSFLILTNSCGSICPITDYQPWVRNLALYLIWRHFTCMLIISRVSRKYRNWRAPSFSRHWQSMEILSNNTVNSE